VANPMMEMLSRSASPRPSNNPLAMIAEFRKFAAGMTPQRAQQQIQEMLADGRMSQDQFQQLQRQAQEFMRFLK
jgi:hypothetical protein